MASIIALSTMAVLPVAACAGTPAGVAPTSRMPMLETRTDAEHHTSATQRQIIDAFPSGAVSDTSTGGWALLDCSDNEIQSSISATMTLARAVPIDETYDAITHEVEAEGYRGEQSTTARGTQLVITGEANDQYFVAIENDKRRVLISSFSQCFPGSLADG